MANTWANPETWSGPARRERSKTCLLASPEPADAQTCALNPPRLAYFGALRARPGIPIVRAACALGRVCEDALHSIRAGWPEQPFVQQLSGDLHLHADADRLQQALSILLGNAVQHGDSSVPVTLIACG